MSLVPHAPACGRRQRRRRRRDSRRSRAQRLPNTGRRSLDALAQCRSFSITTRRATFSNGQQPTGRRSTTDELFPSLRRCP